VITVRVAAVALAAVTLASACSAGSSTRSAGIGAALSPGTAVPAWEGSAAPAIRLVTVPLVVPKSEDAAPFNKPRMLRMPPGYVNNHPPDEVAPVIAGRNLGWPYCNPDQDENAPRGSLANIPFVADSLTNPGGKHLNCARLPRLAVGLPAHTAPLGMSFLEGAPRSRRRGRAAPSLPGMASGTAFRRARRRCCGWPGTATSALSSLPSRSSPDSSSRAAAAGVAPWTSCQVRAQHCTSAMTPQARSTGWSRRDNGRARLRRVGPETLLVSTTR